MIVYLILLAIDGLCTSTHNELSVIADTCVGCKINRDLRLEIVEGETSSHGFGKPVRVAMASESPP